MPDLRAYHGTGKGVWCLLVDGEQYEELPVARHGRERLVDLTDLPPGWPRTNSGTRELVLGWCWHMWRQQPRTFYRLADAMAAE